jgi:hypothetical protein
VVNPKRDVILKNPRIPRSRTNPKRIANPRNKLEKLIYTYQAIHNLERPSYLCRETKSNQAILPNCYKQNIQGYEKTQP